MDSKGFLLSDGVCILEWLVTKPKLSSVLWSCSSLHLLPSIWLFIFSIWLLLLQLPKAFCFKGVNNFRSSCLSEITDGWVQKQRINLLLKFWKCSTVCSFFSESAKLLLNLPRVWHRKVCMLSHCVCIKFSVIDNVLFVLKILQWWAKGCAELLRFWKHCVTDFFLSGKGMSDGQKYRDGMPTNTAAEINLP